MAGRIGTGVKEPVFVFRARNDEDVKLEMQQLTDLGLQAPYVKDRKRMRRKIGPTSWD